MDEACCINVVFGGQKYSVPLPTGTDATLQHLMKAIESVVHVPFYKQRLIYKGRSLMDPDALISSCGLTVGSKVMVLGSVETLDPNEAEKLSKAKSTSESISSELENLSEKLRNINDSNGSEVTVNVKCTVDIMERCMRTLELLDSVRLPYDCENERTCRKQLVDTIQEFLVQADKLRGEFLKLAKTKTT